MMLDKLSVLIIYALGGLVIALFPIGISLIQTRFDLPNLRKNVPKHNGRASILSTLVMLLISSVSVLIIFSSATTPELIGLVLLSFTVAALSAFNRQRFSLFRATLIFATLLLSSTLVWWKQGQLSWFDLFIFFVLFSGVITALRKPFHTSQKITTFSIAIIFLILVISASFLTKQLHSQTLLTAWHHWGAYIGASELFLAGAKIFYDVPIQYGLGPTLLIASACSNSCWEGMYYIVGIVTILYVLLIAYLAVFIANQTTHASIPRWLILLLCFVCCFFWAGYPSNVSLPITFPSSGGLRFLPTILFATLLIRFDYQFQNSSRATYLGHIGWCLCALWSPESGVYASCIWCPYYLILGCKNSASSRAILVSLAMSVMRLVFTVIFFVIFFAAVYWYLYGVLPIASIFFAYALNPPGTLPINFNGAIWFFVVVVILASIHNWCIYVRDGNTPIFRQGFVLLLMTYSVFSYFLGRSHDNNILNIMPMMALVLMHVFTNSINYSTKDISATLLAALIGWLGTLGWDSFLTKDSMPKTIAYDPHWINLAFNTNINQKPFDHDNTIIAFPDDAAKAIAQIKQISNEPITVVSSWNGLASTKSSDVWSAFHGPANIVLFPPETRRLFLSKTAKTLNRSGWLVIPKSDVKSSVVVDFDSVYKRSNEQSFGSYYAIRYAPK